MSDAAKVAIQGEAGSFSHQAALELLGEQVEIVPRASFDALFEAVVSSSADRAVLPIENSLHGSIHENYDRLKASPLHIVGETQLRISHCLVARPGASLASIRRVASHAVALRLGTRLDVGGRRNTRRSRVRVGGRWSALRGREIPSNVGDGARGFVSI